MTPVHDLTMRASRRVASSRRRADATLVCLVGLAGLCASIDASAGRAQPPTRALLVEPRVESLLLGSLDSVLLRVEVTGGEAVSAEASPQLSVNVGSIDNVQRQAPALKSRVHFSSRQGILFATVKEDQR